MFAVALLLVTGLLSGCTTSLDEGEEEGITTDLNEVSVTGEQGKEPAIDVHAPFAITKTDRKVLVTGKGSLVSPGLRVTVDYVAVNGTDGRTFSKSFGTSSSTFTLDANQTIKGMVEGLSGLTVGSRVLIAVPPADAYGTQGNATAGIGPTDSLVFVVDINAAQKVLKRATGKAVKPPASLPTVTLDEKTGEPSISIPKGKAPSKLVVQPLIQGSGATVKKGQTITTHYTGVILSLIHI